ncbi:hypothetical protein [Chryseobacterium sp.]|uniref:hypothetical protein n=1 Tax=Chryseobacterium sp. TaxID=1871047 RepID=UPI00283F99F7|nr:hypothetical protein [Chryseobacterium sp.]MDR3025789.1 hypothetical protein [Chryseobacterium sp.]
MKKKLLFLFYLIICIKTYSQSQRLMGEWFLDRVFLSNGKRLEINNRKYSLFLSYKITPKELMINDQKFKAVFFEDHIKLENRDLTYWYDDRYLLVQDGNEIYTFLKKNDFTKKNPEFNPKINFVKNDTVIIANQIIKPEFNHDKTFDRFISMNISNYSYESEDDLYFKAEFVLTKDNKVTQITILDPYTPQYQLEFIQALKKSEEYFENPYRKDMVITFEKYFTRWVGNSKTKEEKKLYSTLDIGFRYFHGNKFEKTIKTLSQLDGIQIADIEFNPIVREAYISLGISYLAVGKNEQACVSFRKAGDLTDFGVRNYLKDFCK